MLVACGGEPPAEALGHDSAAVLYGEPSGPTEDGVVQVLSKTATAEQNCTGTLVAENVVVTARHCISNFVATSFTCTTDGELAPGSRGGQNGALVAPGDVKIWQGAHPDLGTPPEAVGAEIFAPQATTICRNDIAFVVLDRPISGLPVSPMRLGRGNDPGELLRVVGYGADELNQTGTRRTRSGLKITLVGESVYRTDPDPVPPRTFRTDGPALCYGDSGGPAFTESGAVTGVWSQVIGGCSAATAKNVFTQVAPFLAELVVPAFEAAGAEPIVEPEDPATGGAGSGSTPGSAGEAGETAGGGEGATGGDAAAGGEGGAGDAAGSPPAYHGVRKPGGCRCDVVGAPAGGTGLLSPLVVAWALARRRATSRGASSAARARRSRRRPPSSAA